MPTLVVEKPADNEAAATTNNAMLTSAAGSASRPPMAFPLPSPMRRALELASAAAAAGEVPVGAVVTKGDEVLAEAANAMRG